MAELIEALEIGFFKDKDFHSDSDARLRIAKAAMYATEGWRIMGEAISSQKLSDIRVELGILNSDLDSARSTIARAGNVRNFNRTASSSPLANGERRRPIEPWLSTQQNLADQLSFDLDDFPPPFIDVDLEMT